MKTPVADFIRAYAAREMVRAHMPGHKGRVLTGPEPMDVTEVSGAGELYGTAGPVQEAEDGTAALFASGRTCWATEGSSQCIRAMLTLATQYGRGGRKILAARNAHRAFLTACALLDLTVDWLWPETYSLCSCPVTPEMVERALAEGGEPPAAIYLTTPDYLGGLQDVQGIAAVAHAHGIPLLCDNAHGAYLHFLDRPMHPLDLGADLVCDSAHKTLPALTGCAYLHVAKGAPEDFSAHAKEALLLYGSTSPSWLLLRSLDMVNARLAGTFPKELATMAGQVSDLKARLGNLGWRFHGDEPLKLTLDARAAGYDGAALGAILRRGGIEPEYVDPDFVVLMLSPCNDGKDLARLERVLAGTPLQAPLPQVAMPFAEPERVLSIREAMLGPAETVPLSRAEGRVLAAPSLSCPPAISVVVSGERIHTDAIALLRHHGTETVRVARENG